MNSYQKIRLHLKKRLTYSDNVMITLSADKPAKKDDALKVQKDKRTPIELHILHR